MQLSCNAPEFLWDEIFATAAYLTNPTAATAMCQQMDGHHILLTNFGSGAKTFLVISPDAQPFLFKHLPS